MLEWLFGKKKQQPQDKPQKKKKVEAQDKWMYDFMIQFLSSPIWRVSILDFVDNKCVVFDNQEENKFQYTKIHNEFKELVASLVDGMMQQVGMSEQKLAQILEKGLQSKQRKLFNQLLLADDFLRFKQLMLKRNKALEKQAINALQNGHLNQPQKGKKTAQSEEVREAIRESKRLQDERKKKMEEEEQQMIRKVIQMSKLQSKQNQALKELEKQVALHTDSTDNKNSQSKEQYHNPSNQPSVRQPTKEEPIKQSIKHRRGVKLQSVSKNSQLGDLPPLKMPVSKVFQGKTEQQGFESKNVVHEQVQEKKQPELSPKIEQKPLEEVVPEKAKQQSLEDRKQRLMAQRQKIRKQKQQQRKKQLQSQEKQKDHTHEVHTVVLQQDGIYDTTTNIKQHYPTQKEKPQQQNTVSQDELKRRKQLMNRIKNRIIDDF